MATLKRAFQWTLVTTVSSEWASHHCQQWMSKSFTHVCTTYLCLKYTPHYSELPHIQVLLRKSIALMQKWYCGLCTLCERPSRAQTIFLALQHFWITAKKNKRMNICEYNVVSCVALMQRWEMMLGSLYVVWASIKSSDHFLCSATFLNNCKEKQNNEHTWLQCC